MPCAWLFKRLVMLVPATALLSATRVCACAPEPFLGGWPLLPTAGLGPGPLSIYQCPVERGTVLLLAFVRHSIAFIFIVYFISAKLRIIARLGFALTTIFINLFCMVWGPCRAASLRDAARGGVRE